MKIPGILLLLASSSSAGGISLPAGPIPGNDNEAAVTAIVGHPVKRVGKFEITDESPVFTLTEGIADDLNLILQDQGLSFFFASGVVKGTVDGTNWDYLAVKSGPNWFLYGRTGPLTAFETDCHFLSHVSLYEALPEPSGAVAVLLALIGLGVLRRSFS